MNNNRKRVFRIRHNKGGFRRRGGGQDTTKLIHLIITEALIKMVNV